MNSHPWGSDSPWYDYPTYIRSIFGARVQKVSINAGFTCPNRDGSKGTGGCAFCNNSTFNPDYCDPLKSIGQQIDEGIAFFARKYPSLGYLAYFQAYSNTYGDTSRILSLYREALSHPHIRGLVIGTRPDCLADDLIDELRSMARDHYIAVELGAETTSDDTLRLINRGHTWHDTVDAVRRLSAAGLPVGLHFIMGLPGESRDFQLTTAATISRLPVTFVKLHQLQIVRGSVFASIYRDRPAYFDLWTPDDYIDFCIEFARRLSPRIVIERFVSQAPRHLVLAPSWDLKNYEFAHLLLNAFRLRHASQGDLFSDDLLKPF